MDGRPLLVLGLVLAFALFEFLDLLQGRDCAPVAGVVDFGVEYNMRRPLREFGRPCAAASKNKVSDRLLVVTFRQISQAGR